MTDVSTPEYYWATSLYVYPKEAVPQDYPIASWEAYYYSVLGGCQPTRLTYRQINHWYIAPSEWYPSGLLLQEDN